MKEIDFYRRFGKRWLDLILTLPMLLILAPIMLMVAFLVRLRLGAPILFCQERPGLHGKPFTLYKFRTMTDARDTNGNLLSESERLPAFGRFLRSTSLDELPELFNVLKGEMSLIGPRPLLMRYYPYFTDQERTRFDVRPGITGWAQVHGRSNLPWDDRFALDVWYVQNICLRLDITILVLTVLRVFQRKDIFVRSDNPRLRYDLDVERSYMKKERS